MADQFSPNLDDLAGQRQRSQLADFARAAHEQMTHQPEQPNPAQPYINAVKNFWAPLFNPAAHGGIAGAMEGAGYQLPGWLAAPQAVLNNPSTNQAFMLEAAWTPRELEILRSMVKSGKYDTSLLPGRTPQSLYQRAFKEGLATRASPGEGGGMPPMVGRNREMTDQINKMFEQGRTYSEIAGRLGISDRTLRRYLGEIGGSRRGPKWSDSQRIKQYKDMIAQGYSMEQMARKLGTGISTVHDQVWRLVKEGHLDYTPQGGTRTPSMPSFNLPDEPALGDPEYENLLLQYLSRYMK